MKLMINESVLHDTAVFEQLIHVLIAHKSKHCIDVDSGAKIIPHISSPMSELLKGLIRSSSYSNDYGFSIEVTNECKSGFQVLPDELNDYLCRPAIIIVENGTSDRGFILTALKVMDEHALVKKLNISWEFRSAGGCGEIPKVIEDECGKFKHAPRIVVIHDSDLEHPNSSLNEIHNRIENIAREKGIPSFLLKKREMENYIPNVMIESRHSNNELLLSAFKKLNSNQKDFFDYKCGFSKIKHTAINNLYSNIESDDVWALYKGFGKKISEEAFADDVTYTKDDFRDRCDKIIPEFMDIISVIRSVL